MCICLNCLIHKYFPSYSQMFSLLVRETKKKDFDLSWVQRIDGVVCLVIENYFGILHFLLHFICDFGNIQIGKIAKGTRNKATIFVLNS